MTINYDQYDEKLKMYKINGPWGSKRSSTFVFKGSNLQFRYLCRSDMHHRGIAFRDGPNGGHARKLVEVGYLEQKLKDYNRVALKSQLHMDGNKTPGTIKRFGKVFVDRGLEYAKRTGDYDYTQGDDRGSVQLHPMEMRCIGDFMPVDKRIGIFSKISECDSRASVKIGGYRTSIKRGPRSSAKRGYRSSRGQIVIRREPLYYREEYKNSSFSRDDLFQRVDSDRQINRELGWNHIGVYVVRDLEAPKYYNQCMSICFSRYSPSNPYTGRIMWLFTYPLADYFLTSANGRISGPMDAIKHNFPDLGKFVASTSTRVRDNFNVRTSPSRYANFSRPRKKSMWSALCEAEEQGFCTINDAKKLYACLDDPLKLTKFGFSGQ